MEDISQLSYRELQKLAKEHGIPANLKRDALEKKLTIALNEVQTESEDATNSNADVETPEPVEAEPEVEEETSEDDTVEAQEVAESSEPSDSAVVSERDVEVEDAEAPAVDEDIAEDAAEEEDDVEDCPDECEEDSPEERIGCKLLGIATPVGQKQVFESPAASKSQQKPYEKYNVHWRYEEYENQTGNEQGATVSKTLLSEEEEEEGGGEVFGEDEEQYEMAESPEREGDKLRGIATPQGKSIYFVTPNKTAEKEYLKYNVHWTYEDYVKAGQIDEYPLSPSTLHQEVTSIHKKLGIESQPVSSSQVRNPLASLTNVGTPGSAKKFGFVHHHP